MEVLFVARDVTVHQGHAGVSVELLVLYSPVFYMMAILLNEPGSMQ